MTFPNIVASQVKHLAREHGITAEIIDAWKADVMEDAQGTVNELNVMRRELLREDRVVPFVYDRSRQN